MAKLKIILEGNESVDEVKELIVKAFSHQDVHEHLNSHHRPFTDPVLRDIHALLNHEFSEMYAQMFNEIETVIKNPQLQDLY